MLVEILEHNDERSPYESLEDKLTDIRYDLNVLGVIMICSEVK